MKVLVIDVAAEHGGAITILNQYVETFIKDLSNNYIVLLSIPSYENRQNVRFINYKWVKNSLLHRLWFDYVYILKIVKEIQPECVLSLQNCAIPNCGKKQIVYFQNALPISDFKYSIFKSKSIWMYQNIIGRLWKLSLKNADEIIVQAEWVKESLSAKWHIPASKITVKQPNSEIVIEDKASIKNSMEGLFYPANRSIYKNHELLFEAMIDIWKSRGDKFPVLYLTGNIDTIPQKYRQLIKEKHYPVVCLGRLNTSQMIEYYCKSMLVFPSLIETVGLPLLEAKSLKRPIIASDLPYAHEALKSYNNCFYFNPLSKMSMVDAIQKALSTNNL